MAEVTSQLANQAINHMTQDDHELSAKRNKARKRRKEQIYLRKVFHRLILMIYVKARCSENWEKERQKGVITSQTFRSIFNGKGCMLFQTSKGPCLIYKKLQFSIPWRLPLESNLLAISFDLFACEIIYTATASNVATCTHLSISRNFFPLQKV